MANRRLFQFLYTRQPKLTMVNGLITFGAGGVVASAGYTTVGIYSVTGFGNGIFQIKMQDNYYAYVGAQFSVHSGISASAVNVASFTGSSAYQVSTVGNSTWSTVGFDTDYTVAVGAPFIATAVAGSGTGAAKLITASNISGIQIIQNQSQLLTNIGPNYGSNTGGVGKGASIFFQTVAPTSAMVSSASVVSMAVTNPTGSTQCSFKLWFRDSSAPVGN